MKKGTVYLVGAGPGDPELITVKALKTLEKADCIIYDYLSNFALLADYNCEKIYVGKQGKSHTKTQDEINDLLIRKAKAGKMVVRLKGGDPFIFGRGGEEAESLLKKDIPFQVIPGISSFYAASAYAGIPLTHRDFSDAIEVITGHRRGDLKRKIINLPEYKKRRTYTFLMGMENLSFITRTLIKQKKFPALMPVAIVSWGTKPNQKTVIGTLSNIVSKVEKSGIKAPAIIIIGQVVKLRKKLNWFEELPLFGEKIVVTRTRQQASKLSEQLTNLGAEVIEVPTIEIKLIKDLNPLKKALNKILNFNWLVFTSPNAVDIFWQFLDQTKKDIRILSHLKIAVIGPATAEKLLERGIKPDLMPKKYVAESLWQEFKKRKITKAKILLPCSKNARQTLKEGLENLGHQVTRIHIYETVKPASFSEDKKALIAKADFITFTSSSTAQNFFAVYKKTKATLACIGPITAMTVKELGFKADLIAKEYTIKGLVQAILDYKREDDNDS